MRNWIKQCLQLIWWSDLSRNLFITFTQAFNFYGSMLDKHWVTIHFFVDFMVSIFGEKLISRIGQEVRTSIGLQHGSIFQNCHNNIHHNQCTWTLLKKSKIKPDQMVVRTKAAMIKLKIELVLFACSRWHKNQQTYVVYFNWQMGALHTVHWVK